MQLLWKAFVASIFSLILLQTAQAGAPQVLFDQGHGQLFYIDQQGTLDLSQLADTFSEAGFAVSSTNTPLTAAALETVDALIISGAFRSPTISEIDAIQGFIQRGGKLAVMLHVGPLVIPLLNSLNVSVSMGVLHDTTKAIGGKSSDFPVSSLAGHVLFDQIKSFELYGAWGLNPNVTTVRIMAMTEPSAWLDNNRDQVKGNNPQGRFPVIVRGVLGAGEYLVFGDDAIFQNQFMTGNNRQLANNMALWMKP